MEALRARLKGTGSMDEEDDLLKKYLELHRQVEIFKDEINRATLTGNYDDAKYIRENIASIISDIQDSIRRYKHLRLSTELLKWESI